MTAATPTGEEISRTLELPTGPVTLTLRPTNDPDTYFVDSATREGSYYRVLNATRPDITCSCLASRDCKHLVAVAEYVASLRPDPAERVKQAALEAVAGLEGVLENLDAIEADMRETGEPPAETPAEAPPVAQEPDQTPDPVSTTAVALSTPAASYSRRGGVLARQDLTTRAELARHSAMAAVQTLSQCLILARHARAAGLVPMVAKDKPMSEEAAALVLMRSLELGIPWTSAFNYLYVVGGRVSVQSEMVLALVNRSGVGTISIVSSDETQATVRGRRPGHPDLVIQWTFEMTEKAGILTNTNTAAMYKKFRPDMLRYKAIARVGRLMFPDITAGMDVTDGEGVVIDAPYEDAEYAVVIEGSRESNRQTRAARTDAPTPVEEPKRAPGELPAWWPDYVAAMRDPGFTHRQAAEFLDVASNREALLDGIDYFLTFDPPTTPAGLVESIAAWEATGRKTRTRVVKAPPPAAAPEPEPAEDIAEAEYREAPLFDLPPIDEPAADPRGIH